MDKKNFISLIALSGLLLSILYPIGMFVGTNHPLFTTFFVLHLLVHGTLVVFSLRLTVGCFSKDLLGSTILIFGVLLPVVLIFLIDLLPVTNRDALIHHLAVPKWWLSANEIHTIPWHEWSYYPMLIQLAFTGFLKFGSSIGCTLYHASYLVLLGGLFSFLNNSEDDSRVSQLGILFVCTTPILIRLGTAPYVDIPLTLYALSFFFILQCDSKEDSQTKGFVIGILLGLLAATKYNGLLFTGIATIGGVFFYRKLFFSHLPRIVIGGALVSLPWYLKNLIVINNPVYPLFRGFLNPEETTLQVPRIGGISNGDAIDSSPLSFLLDPPKMFFFGVDDNPALYDGVLSPLLIFSLVPLFFLVKNKNRKEVLFGIFLIIAYTYTAILLSGPRIRYLAPIFGIMIYLSALGIRELLDSLKPKIRPVLFTLLVVGQTSLGLLYIGDRIVENKLTSYLSGKINSVRYVNENVSESLLADATRENLPEESKIYLLYTGNRYFLYDQPVINSGYDSDRLLVTWIKRSATQDELLSYIESYDIDYIALHNPRYLRTFDFYQKAGFLEEENLTLWNEFVTDSLKPVFEIGPYQVWKIESSLTETTSKP